MIGESPINAASFASGPSPLPSEQVAQSSPGTDTVRSGLPTSLGDGLVEATNDRPYVVVHGMPREPSEEGDSKQASIEGAVVPYSPAMALPVREPLADPVEVAELPPPQAPILFLVIAGELPDPPAQLPPMRQQSILHDAARIMLRNGALDVGARIFGGAVRSAVVAAMTGTTPPSFGLRAPGIVAGGVSALGGALLLGKRSTVAGVATGISTLTLVVELVLTRRWPGIRFLGQLAGAWATELSRELAAVGSEVYLRVPQGINAVQRARLEREPLSAVMGPGYPRAFAYVLCASLVLLSRMLFGPVLPPTEIRNALTSPQAGQGSFDQRWFADFQGEVGQAVLEGAFSAIDAVVVARTARERGLELHSGPARSSPGHVARSASVRFALDTLTLLLGALLSSMDPDENRALIGAGLMAMAAIQGLKRLRAHAVEESVARPTEPAWTTLSSNDVQVGPGSSLRRWPRVQPAE